MKLSLPSDERNRLMLDHAHALLGTFVTSITMVETGHWEIRSSTFPDEIDWNLDVLEPSIPHATTLLTHQILAINCESIPIESIGAEATSKRLTVPRMASSSPYLQRQRIWVAEPWDALTASNDQTGNKQTVGTQTSGNQTRSSQTESNQTESSQRNSRSSGQNQTGTLLGTEHWLALTPSSRLALQSLQFDGTQTASVCSKPDQEFCDIFAAAFELEAHEDRSYRKAFLEGQSSNDVHTLHVTVAVGGIPAAIASLHSTPHNSFLYNVGTHPDYRGQGLGRRAIIELLRASGAHPLPVWLQCEADSQAERLYQFLGFETMFAASVRETVLVTWTSSR
jgi:ribosomal protein S18 acetylase RimI-like enzyme